MASPRAPHILLHCSWQTYNIGDIAHTPGAFGVLRRHVPEATVTLWPGPLDDATTRMLREHCPGMPILDPQDETSVERAIADADLLLHGPGPNLIRRPELRRWIATGKPWGALGITLERIDEHNRDIVESATFIFTRETASLERLRISGVAVPTLEFAPDATVALTISDELAGRSTLERFGLREKRFVCAVPRLRYTPYHEFKPSIGWDAERIAEVERVNREFAEPDHATLAQAIDLVLDQTDLDVLLCPEMSYQVELLRPLIGDRIATRHQPRVHAMDRYWLTAESAAVYASAASVVSLECHSPLIAISQGTPAVHLRQPEDTIKGQMYRDLELGAWLFEIGETNSEELAGTLVRQVEGQGDELRRIKLCQETAEQSLSAAAVRIREVLCLA